eukprot:4390905-Ditylum_brightwellii.AAC.1
MPVIILLVIPGIWGTGKFQDVFLGGQWCVVYHFGEVVLTSCNILGKGSAFLGMFVCYAYQSSFSTSA